MLKPNILDALRRDEERDEGLSVSEIVSNTRLGIGRTAYGCQPRVSLRSPVVGYVPATNLDLLDWFDKAEREQCPVCRQQTLVGVRDAPLFRVCLGCAATWVAGERIDTERRLDAA